MFAQQSARTGGAATAGLAFAISQQAVNGRGADLFQEFALAGQQRIEVFGVVGQPKRQRRSKAFAAELLGVLPDVLEHLAHRQIFRLGARRRLILGFGQPVAQQFDAVLATVAVLLAKFVEHPGFAVLVAPGVALAQPQKLLLSIQLIWHFHPHRFGCHFPVRQRMLFAPLFLPPSVSFILSQLVDRAATNNHLDAAFVAMHTTFAGRMSERRAVSSPRCGLAASTQNKTAAQR